MLEIYFCNLCDESVPLADLETGQALRLQDRVVCSVCHELLRRAAPAAPRGGGGVVVLLALLAGLLACLAVALTWWKHDRSQQALSTRLDEQVKELGAQGTDLGRGLAENDSRDQEERSLLKRQIEGLQDDQGRVQKELEGRFAGLQNSLDEIGRLAAAQDNLLRRLADAESNLSVMEDRQRAFRSTQEGMRDELARIGEQARAAASAAAPQPAAAENPFSPEISALLRALQDDDPEVRYGALEKLAAFQDARLLPHLYPLLADPYEFTRFLAAHTLGEWQAMPAVPHLIEALLDEVGFVREAAVRSLRRITGQNFAYDHEADAEQRKLGYQLWKTWWEANGAALLEEQRG